MQNAIRKYSWKDGKTLEFAFPAAGEFPVELAQFHLTLRPEMDENPDLRFVNHIVGETAAPQQCFNMTAESVQLGGYPVSVIARADIFQLFFCGIIEDHHRTFRTARREADRPAGDHHRSHRHRRQDDRYQYDKRSPDKHREGAVLKPRGQQHSGRHSLRSCRNRGYFRHAEV